MARSRGVILRSSLQTTFPQRPMEVRDGGRYLTAYSAKTDYGWQIWVPVLQKGVQADHGSEVISRIGDGEWLVRNFKAESITDGGPPIARSPLQQIF